MTDTTISDKATLALTFFEKSTRGDGTEYWNRKDGSPAWVQELAFAAHQDGTDGGMLPDDYRYEFLVDALNGFAENEDADDYQPSEDVSVYTHDLTAWLASRNDRLGYCDEAASEYGFPNGSGTGSPTFNLLVMGQTAEREEVANNVRSFLESLDLEA